jgi:hypothetical protein
MDAAAGLAKVRAVTVDLPHKLRSDALEARFFSRLIRTSASPAPAAAGRSSASWQAEPGHPSPWTDSPVTGGSGSAGT